MIKLEAKLLQAIVAAVNGVTAIVDDISTHSHPELREANAHLNRAADLLQNIKRGQSMAFEWGSMESAPKDGTDILICTPGGHSDHYYPVCWDVDESIWRCRWLEEMTLTDEELLACHLAPMWTRIPAPPSSLCYDASWVRLGSVQQQAEIATSQAPPSSPDDEAEPNQSLGSTSTDKDE